MLIKIAMIPLLLFAAYFGFRSASFFSAELKENSEYFEITTFKVPDKTVGCKAMVDDYCSQLYSNQSQGNLKVFDGKNEYLTLQGQTNNNFDNPWFFFYSARLENENRLPKDLAEALQRRQFFTKLKQILQRPNRKDMPLEQNIQHSDLEAEVDQIWRNSFAETVVKRLESKYPGSYKLTDEETAQEIEFEKARIRKRLWSEISISLWSKSKNWKKVKKDFLILKKAYKQTIQNVLSDEVLKKKWIEKLNKVELTLPGQNPVTANSDCISVSRNAYYYPYLNTLTVCAGYFNGGQQIQTLSHELSHAFDNSSHVIDDQQRSQFVKTLRKFKKNVCLTTAFHCGAWDSYKKSFAEDLEKLSRSRTPLYSFNKCLQKRALTKTLSEDVFAEKSEEIVKKRISDLTTNASFLRITSEDLPMPNGKIVKNPNYLNPCSYSVWDQDPFALDSDLVTLLYFTAAYRCESSSPQEKLKTAVQTSREMTKEVLKVILKMEGEFSAREELQATGHSLPTSERFADRLGSDNVAEYLSRFQTVAEKRGRYLVSSFWLCEKPSLKNSNLEMLNALSEYIFDHSLHSENDERLKDWLSPKVQEQLQCQKDFETKECSYNESEGDPVTDIKFTE